MRGGTNSLGESIIINHPYHHELLSLIMFYIIIIIRLLRERMHDNYFYFGVSSNQIRTFG